VTLRLLYLMFVRLAGRMVLLTRSSASIGTDRVRSAVRRRRFGAVPWT